MSKASRGGLTLKTGKIGRVNCLRQQVMMPGERLNISMNGKVRLETLRERDVMRINAHLGVFMTPLRWLWPDYPDYVKQGPQTALHPPVVAASANWDRLGIGSYQGAAGGSYFKHFEDAYLRVYNEWYKWPEDSDHGSVNVQGEKAVPLSKTWSRCRYNAKPLDEENYTIDATTAPMDVRALSETQAAYRSAMKRDVLSYNRWQELISDSWKGSGSREVDQVPILLDQTSVGVNPREMPATDGASLGQWQSMFDFNLDHQIRGVVAPEHCIITYMLTLRFASVIEGCSPLATDRLDWFEFVADPEYLSSKHPMSVTRRDLQQTDSATSLGFLPAGWQWRSDHDVIGQQIDTRDSFPYMINPTTMEECKDATRVKDAFRSQALDDYVVDVFVKEDSTQPIGDSMDSYMAGMVDDATPYPGASNQEFPKGGKML